MRPVPVLGKLAFAGFLLALIMALTAAFGTRLGAWDYHFGLLTLLPLAVYVAIAALTAGLVWGILAFFTKSEAPARYGLIGLFGAAAVLVLPLYGLYAARTSPPIHDISTDIADPPSFQALQDLRKDGDNELAYDGAAKVIWKGKAHTVAQWQRKYYTDIFTKRLLMPPAKLYARARKAAEAMGWTIIAASPQDGRIEATDTSFFFGFTADIVIRVRPSGEGAKLDIRSESRMRKADDGTNAARIRDFMKTLAKTKA